MENGRSLDVNRVYSPNSIQCNDPSQKWQWLEPGKVLFSLCKNTDLQPGSTYLL